MVTLTNAENALKSVYLDAVTELLNTKANPLLARIEQTSSDVWGKEIRKAVSWGINGGIGAGDEDGDLPAAHGTDYYQFVTTLKNLYGQIEISDKAIRASADGRGAFTDLLSAELNNLLQASRFNLGRMLYGDGTGALTTIASNTAKTAYTVAKTNNLIEGLVVDLYTAAGVPSKAGLRIKSIDRDKKEISFYTDPGEIAAGSILFVQGSKDKEITGLGAVFEADTLYGVSRTLDFMKPKTQDNAGLIDEIMIQRMIDRLDTEANSTVDYIAVSNDVKLAYQQYMLQYKRNVDVMELDGGYKTLSYNGIPLVYDRFVEDGTMYLLNTSAFKLHRLCDWKYLETENGKILRQTQGKPTYTATLVKYCDLICDRPNGQGKISGITAE